MKPLVEVKIPVVFYHENDQLIAYTPALDICGYGSNMDDTKKSFEDAVDIFIREALNHNTLEKSLLALGWQRVLTEQGTYTWNIPQTPKVPIVKIEHRETHPQISRAGV